MRRATIPLLLALLLGLGGAAFTTRATPVAAATCADFPETGHQVCGDFLTYWQGHGGLVQQGYPVSDLFTEQSTTDGKTYQVQYFERAVFELHLEISGPDKVLLSQIGRDTLRTRYPTGLPANAGGDLAPTLTGNCQQFAETGQSLCGTFLTYWETNGGLAQQGYPLTGVFNEKSTLDNTIYQVQYFERAVFEYHPENAAPNDILLSQIGRARFTARYPDGPGSTDTAFLTIGKLTLNTVNNNYVEWNLPIKNISGQQLLSVLITIVFYDANGNQLDTTIAGATNLNPNESRVVHGISVKGVGYAKYQIKTPEVLIKP